MAAHAFNPSTLEAKAGFLSSRSILSIHRLSSRTAKATKRNSISKKQKTKQQQKKSINQTQKIKNLACHDSSQFLGCSSKPINLFLIFIDFSGTLIKKTTMVIIKF